MARWPGTWKTVGEVIKIVLFQVTQNMLIFVSCVNAHQRVPSAEVDFNSTVDGMWIPVSLFPQPPLALPNGLMNKMAMVAWMEVVSGLGNMTSTYQGQLGYGHC